MMENIAKALNAFQKELPEVKMDATVKVQTKSGSSYNFKYATLGNIVKTITPYLAKQGLSFTQPFDGDFLKTILYHTSGESITSCIPIDVKSGTMQEVGSRISYLKRYSLTSLLGVVSDSDDDANIADGNAYQKTDKQTSEPKADRSNDITEKQWGFIKSIGMKEHELTEEEVIELVKWVAERENIKPRHYKIAKLLLPKDNFNKVFEEWNKEMSIHGGNVEDGFI